MATPTNVNVALPSRVASERHLADRLKLTDLQVSEFKQAFQLFDSDRDGAITVAELPHAMKALGFEPTDEELARIILKTDTNQDGNLDFAEFCDMMAARLTTVATHDELREAFHVFELVEAPNMMPASEIKFVLEHLAENLSEDEVALYMDKLDPHHTGRVSFAVFRDLLTKPYEPEEADR